ncbi:MAG: ribonuclease III, partial [Bacteroidales bacterium]|nr:ribonuclease III [Bacteroidales bacterium]
GFMTKLRSKIVNREILNQLAVSVGINDLLKCNVGPANSVRNLYGDALEALVGALFLDKGFKKTRKIFIKNVLNKYLIINDIVNTDNDYKSLVFEWVQKHKHNLTFTYKEEYDFNSRKSVFTTILLIDNEEFGQGQGSSKKEAEQEASARAWEKIKKVPET